MKWNAGEERFRNGYRRFVWNVFRLSEEAPLFDQGVSLLFSTYEDKKC